VTGGFEWSRSDGALRCWRTPGQSAIELPLGDRSETASFTLVSGLRQYQVGLLPRPSWAIEWGIESRGLYALAPSPLGEPVRLFWHDWDDGLWTGAWPPSAKAFRAIATPIGQGMQLGADLQHGLYLDVPFGNATQRFRWIEPGEFLMGSPEDEEGRDASEGPQHVVRLTEGFWLADTACSQALWVAVMGDNPSRSKDDPQKPVDRVSWHEVSRFLRSVEGFLGGVKADLPTEAEWEYACRSGTRTAFGWESGAAANRVLDEALSRFGDATIDHLQYVPVAVRSFAPNRWGLYQMHGNVWEWCADGLRKYANVPQVNPRGPEIDEDWRVVRGGAWIDDLRRLRSACRTGRPRDGRRVDQGFRFLLRSTSPGAERPPEALATWADRIKAWVLGEKGPDSNKGD
jgi:formylglycine-generating enzyme required for sulfatase activity